MKAKIISKPTFNTVRMAFNTGRFLESPSIIVDFTTINTIYNLQIIVVKGLKIVVKVPKLVV